VIPAQAAIKRQYASIVLLLVCPGHLLMH
jgi:hypothetical protein